VLEGTKGNDVFVARGGRDKVIAKGGVDKICTGSGQDVVVGGADRDQVAGGPSGDVLRGGGDSDDLHGNAGADVLAGGVAADFLRPSSGNDVVRGGEGPDVVQYFDARNGIRADLGRARVRGAGTDRVFSVSQIEGTKFDDVLIGGNASEALLGYGGDDRLRGRGGLDYLWGGAADDSLQGGSGADYAIFYDSPEPVVANLVKGRARGEGRDDLSGIASLFGSSHADTLIGDAGENHFFGGSPGDFVVDEVEGRGGPDLLYAFGDASFDGGAGTDTIRFLTGPAVADLSTGIATSGGFAFSLSGVEAIIGTGEDDQLAGDAGANRFAADDGDDVLSGAEGSDALRGDAGDDQLDGGLDDDVLDGGPGTDRCVNGETARRCEDVHGPGP
jgi:Ca2+-binding RTX toxin-like protein